MQLNEGCAGAGAGDGAAFQVQEALCFPADKHL